MLNSNVLKIIVHESDVKVKLDRLNRYNIAPAKILWNDESQIIFGLQNILKTCSEKVQNL